MGMRMPPGQPPGTPGQASGPQPMQGPRPPSGAAGGAQMMAQHVPYPTFPNAAGIGLGQGYEQPQLVGGPPAPTPDTGENIIPYVPHAPMRFIPRAWQPDPVQAVDSIYNPYPTLYSPWGDASRDGR